MSMGETNVNDGQICGCAVKDDVMYNSPAHALLQTIIVWVSSCSAYTSGVALAAPATPLPTPCTYDFPSVPTAPFS